MPTSRRPHKNSSNSINLGRRKPMEDADSISFWYKIAAFTQYNIPKIKKGEGVLNKFLYGSLGPTPYPFIHHFSP